MSLHRRHIQQGLTLLEIMIALSLGAFMLVGIISLMASVSSTRTELSRSSEQIENGRYAIQILTEDVALAGYYGPYFHGGPNRSNPDPCSTALANLGIVQNATPTFPPAISSVEYGGALPACVSNAIANAEVLVVRHVNPNPVTAAAAVAGVPYLQVSFCDTENEFVFTDTNLATSLTLKGSDCATVQPAWSYESRAYYVASCDECGGGGDGIPTLKVVEFAAGALLTRSLVEGVEDMHVEYGMDINGDGSPDCYVSDPTVDAAPAGCTGTWETNDALSWANVVSVDVNLLIRSINAYPGWSDTNTYDLGRANESGPFEDGFKRKLMKTSILIPNVAGVRE